MGIRSGIVVGIGILALIATVQDRLLYAAERDRSFGEDVAFLKRHTDAVILRQGDSRIVVVPQFQGRVMTATAAGDRGQSSGWINYGLVAQGVLPATDAKGTMAEHMYAFGGEERFWMGPEGGQYSIFFAPGSEFQFDQWFTPDAIDNEPWTVVSQSPTRIKLQHSFALQNHSETKFTIRADRSIRLLNRDQVCARLETEAVPASLDIVAYQSNNTVTNVGTMHWRKQQGLLSIWMLCMFKPSPTTTVFIPYQQDLPSSDQPIVNDDYFGQVPPNRLKVRDGVVYFRCDGKARGKIGLLPERSMGVAGSYDPAARRVTLLLFDQPKEHQGYVNSTWQIQDHPYRGDAVNSYNDGPVDESGEQLGPFYELESSSPALELAPQESATHSQTVLHLYGSRATLQNAIAALAPIDLDVVASVFGASDRSHATPAQAE